MNKIIKIFQVFGFWDDKNEKNERNAWTETVKLFQFSFFASFLLLLGVGAITSDDKNEAVFLAATALAIGVQVVRLFYIIWKRSEIIALMDKVSFIVQDAKDFACVNNQVKNFMQFVASLVLIIASSMAAAFGFFAISDEKKLPANIAFPLDYKNSELGYRLAFSYIVIATIYSMIIFLLNIIIWYLMLSISIKYYLLGNHFKRLGNIRNMETKTKTQRPEILEKEKDTSFLLDLIAAIKIRQHTQETIVQFNSCFSAIILIQITTSGMGIGGSVYTLAYSYHDTLSQTLIYAALLLYNFFDIFMVMYFGHKIKFSGDRLSYCLFESNWIAQTSSCKKCIIILLEVLKRQHELVIGKLYRLNLETFTSILNLAYSMFNILQSLS